ncbi:hypothetical protein HYS97_00620 [Candidatus Daviesbacteria bacterium]|nr:hypothetical protein [Candidatus Daviesbacteria bacterium]
MLNEFILKAPKRILILITVLIVVFLALVFLAFKKPAEETLPVKSFNPLEKTQVGKTRESDIEVQFSPAKKFIATRSGEMVFELESISPLRPDEIRAKEGLVIFERIRLPENPSQIGYSTISSFKVQFGQPEKTIKGSKFYGPLFETLIYSSKGVTIIGNPFTDEIFEVQRYTPTSIEDYINRYGEDIEEGVTVKEAPPE